MSTIEQLLAAQGFDPAQHRRVRPAAPLDALFVPGAETLTAWKRLREAFPETGLYPLIIGSEHWADTLRAQHERYPFPFEELVGLVDAWGPEARATWKDMLVGETEKEFQKLLGANPKRFPRQPDEEDSSILLEQDVDSPESRRLQQMLDRLEDINDEQDEEASDALLEKLVGEFFPGMRQTMDAATEEVRKMLAQFRLEVPSEPPPAQEEREVVLRCAYGKLNDELLPEVCIALLPIAEPWQAPLAVRFGGFNACPDPVEAALHHRAWAERWGAEPVGITDDTLEFLVRQPPRTEVEALEAARAQLEVAPGDGPIRPNVLARELLGDRHWFFWWD